MTIKTFAHEGCNLSATISLVDNQVNVFLADPHKLVQSVTSHPILPYVFDGEACYLYSVTILYELAWKEKNL